MHPPITDYAPIYDQMWRELPLWLSLVLSYICVLVYSGWRRSRCQKVPVPIRRYFGLTDVVMSLCGPLLAFGLVFAVVCGYLNFWSISHLFCINFDNWLRRVVTEAGLQVPTETQYQQIKIFLASLCAMAISVPQAVLAGIGPRAFDNIDVSPKDIKFPARFLFALRYRLRRKWDDLASTHTFNLSSGANKKRKQLILSFRSGGRVTLNWDEIPASAVNALLQAICTYAPDSTGGGGQTNTDALSIKGPPPPAPATFTELWESDFKQHFRSTTFVPLAAGDRLQDGKYKVLNQLSSTPVTATYIAEQENGTQVILKESVAPIESEAGRQARESYLRECEHLSRLNHPRVAKVMDNFVENGRCYLALEYLPGEDLKSRLAERGRLSEEEILTVARQVADILQYLHEQVPPIIHRDISPDNLILDKSKKVYLIDFGAANRFEANVTGTLIGKQSYIAPEQLRGKAEPQSDIYSLGATMFTLLTGKEPDALSVCYPRDEAPFISEDLNELVVQCTQLDLHRRIGTAAELKQRIEELDAGRAQCIKLKIDDLHRTITLKSNHDAIKLKRL